MATSVSAHDLVQVHIELEGAPEDTLAVVSLEGREAISKLFELQVTAVSTRGLNGEAMLGLGATLVFSRGEEELRRMFGMIASVHDGFETESEHATYRLVFVPRAFRMTLHDTLDIFMDLTVPEIVEKKLQLAGLVRDQDYELRLIETYAKREFVVQYRESDIAFISRLTEHIGLSFFFEHRDGRDVFVLTDHNGGFQPVSEGSLQFRPRGDRRSVYKLESTARLIPSEYLVRDYNYRTPQVDLAARADVDGAGGRVVEYGAHFKTNEEAARVAKVRSEELLAARRILDGESDVALLRAGAILALDEHPFGDLQLLITEVTHSVTQVALGSAAEARRYTNTFKAILKSTSYRPPRVTPKPKVHGVLTGVVDAAKLSQYAEIDGEGRYHVRFLFDTSDTPGGQASRPVRMMQPHSGAGYGMHFPLRGGVEVLIVCVDGDPDRPIIAGTVPNPQTASPVVAGNAPRNIIRTGGNNEINIDDTEDAQRIKLTTPKANTLLQLGAHNDPVEGVSLKTDGHSSNAAIEGSSQWSTLGIQMSALVDLLKAGNIVNVATAPNIWAVANVGAGLYQSVVAGTPGADALYNASKSSIEKRKQELFKAEAEKNKLAIVASQAAKNKQQECNLCKLAAKNALPATANQDPAIQQLIADYEAACATCDDTFLSAIGTMEDRNGIVDANRTNFLNDNFEPVMNRDAYAAVATYDYPAFEALMLTQDEAAWNALSPTQQTSLVATTDTGTDAQKLAAAKARFMASQKEKWIAAPISDEDTAYYAAETTAKQTAFDGLTTAQKDAIPAAVWTAAGVPADKVGHFDQLTDAQKAALKAAFVEDALPSPPDASRVRDAKLAKLNAALAANSNYAAYKTALAGCAAKCGAELDAARAAAVQTNEDYAQLMADNTATLYHLQDLSNQTQTAAANYTTMSINAMLTLYATIEMFLARSSVIERWGAIKDVAKNSIAEATSTAAYAKIKPWQIPFIRPQHTHVIGSDQSTEIYGQRDAVVWSKTAMLLGMGSEDGPGGLKALLAAQLPGSPGATPDKAVGTAIVMGMESAELLSPTRVSIQAGWDRTAANSKNRASLNLLTKQIQGVVRNGGDVIKSTIDLTVDGNDKGKIVVETAGGRKLEIAEHQPKITLEATNAYSLALDEQNQKTSLKGNANYTLDLDHAATASILKGGIWQLKLHEGAANGVTLGVDNAWRLKIKDNDVDLGVHGAGPKLHITNANTTLSATNELHLDGPQKINLTTAKFVVGGAEIDSANLLVKGDLAQQAVITQLQGQVQAAQQAAAMAILGALQASNTAQQALNAVPRRGPIIEDVD